MVGKRDWGFQRERNWVVVFWLIRVIIEAINNAIVYVFRGRREGLEARRLLNKLI